MSRKRIKVWSYNQITTAVEESIRVEMELAAETADPRMRHIYEVRAAGALGAWRKLTMGWQQHGDSRRLEGLTRLPETAAVLAKMVPVEYSADCYVCRQTLDTRFAVPLERRGEGQLYRHGDCHLPARS
jgi:hypothetical protein